MCGARGLPATRIGVVDGDAIEVQGEFTLPLAELRTAHEAGHPGAAGLTRRPSAHPLTPGAPRNGGRGAPGRGVGALCACGRRNRVGG